MGVQQISIRTRTARCTVLLLLLLSYCDKHHCEAFSSNSSNGIGYKNKVYGQRISQVTTTPTTLKNGNFDAAAEVDAVLEEAVAKGKKEKERQEKLAGKKRELIQLLGASSSQTFTETVDPVLASPKSKVPLKYSTVGPVIVGATRGIKIKFEPVSLGEEEEKGIYYEGRTDTYYNLLTSVQEQQQEEGTSEKATDENEETTTTTNPQNNIINNARVLIPPPIRSALVTYGIIKDETYIPMRDLFTSPSVSFAYERGWRQGFAAAGFPGADREFDMAMEYFQPILDTRSSKATTIVDMSCATGLFTRRFAKSNKFNRVLGCDYSQSMLTEARRRIDSDNELGKNTRLELVQLDVAKIPMQSSSIDCLHAGAAMHCWPELDDGLKEIYRVLKPNGGRFFATTFLSKYFAGVQAAEGGKTGPQMQAFQYFESADDLRTKMIKAGFEPNNVSIEILGTACAVIRCEK